MEPENYHHVLLTRFNVLWSEKVPFRGRDPQWLEERFELFDRYCFPSVVSQTCQNFTWLVFFDSDTPEPYRERIDRYRLRYEQFVPIFVPKFTPETFISTLSDCGFLSSPYLVTSRLDNDDALAKDYIKRVQRWVRENRPNEPTFLNFYRGCILAKGRLFLGQDRRSHFASLWEPSECQITVYRNHMEMEKWGFVEQLAGAPAWLEVRHPGRLSAKEVPKSWAPLPRFVGRYWFPTIAEFQSISIADMAVYPLRVVAWITFRMRRFLVGRLARLLGGK